MKQRKQAQYESIRRREQATLERLAALLRRVDNIPPAMIEQVRDACFHADHPFLIVLVGPFNAGKSTIINALIGAHEMETGPTPTTRRVVILRHGPSEQEVKDSADTYTRFHPAPILERVSFVDTPGLESVFTQHDAITRRFLHRADLVMLVMLATQALTADSMADLSALYDYGKPVIILVNQADLLTAEERREVHTFIVEECKRQLGSVPTLWLVSGKAALEAEARSGPQWKESNIGAVLGYINTQLNDEQRLRQKLHTPLKIGQNVTRTALALVQADLESLDAHRGAAENIHAQIDHALTAQQQIIDEYAAMVTPAFDAAATRGAQAIADMFQLRASLRLLWHGLAELVGLARFSRRLSAERYAEQTFEKHAVNRPLDALRTAMRKLAPRLEGNDLKDIDRLVAHGRAQAAQLPDALRAKMIGRVEAPATYKRDHLQKANTTLERIVKDATAIDGVRLERAVRNAVMLLAGWEVMVLMLVIILNVPGAVGSKNGAALLLGVVIVVMLGFLWMPLQALRMARGYTKRIDRLRDDYARVLNAATQEHLNYARQVRIDAVQPYTRLIETQTEEQEARRDALSAVQQALDEIEQTLQQV